jgi:DNA-binding protein H-NS
MATYQDLLAQKAALEKQQAALEKQLEEARKAERAEVISQIRNLMSQHGLTLADLGATRGPGKPAKAGAVEGRKVAPKYRNSATGETWTGRGLQPKWIKEALASGRKLEDLAI